ncbi:hypothetical protein DL98DRAFT_595757 [Cadophora sp. DSE1049]|nr:hypothetical protein DL98DRAFT_595757 [Cadophora sp. DSE1049]
MHSPKLYNIVFLLFTSLASASNIRSNVTRICGSEPSTSLLEQAAEFSTVDFSDEELLGRTIGSTHRKPQVIETYFHVLVANKTLEGGWVPKTLLKKQLKVIQDNFRTTYSLYSNWTSTGPDLATRKKLRTGSRRALNVYIVSTFTDEYQTGWLSLFHTFEGWNCTGPGDFVDDTPAQAFSIGSCYAPIVWDTCPDEPGLDAVHNYMDYTEDSCKTEFTKGQVKRMWGMWKKYRA